MCLAVPGLVEELFTQDEVPMARVNFNGVKRAICLKVVDAKVGDYVLVHAGLAISVIDEEEAERTLKILKDSGELDEISE